MALFSKRLLTNSTIKSEDIVEYIYQNKILYEANPKSYFLEMICNLLISMENGEKFYSRDDVTYIAYYTGHDFQRIYNKAKSALYDIGRKEEPLMVFARINDQNHETCYFYVFLK